MHDSSNKPIILFATPPPLDQLGALTIRLSASAHSIARFQPQVIKCREFIFTEPEVIGTPSPDINDHCFHLVAKISFINAGKLQARLSRIGLQATKPYPVTTELYESCLRYTLLARLSPNWNKAGPWLVQGRDFLTFKGCANAVKMNVNVHHDELFFTLEAAVLKLAPLQVTDLDIIGNHLQIFQTNPAAQIDRDSIASDWCFILPSMKRGHIVSISHELPEDSPFKTYRDLKRHWKNTYGYRLPENEDDMNFYQIRFGPLGGKLFTYPECCLRGRDLQRVARVDPKPILRAFMQEIQNKFPTVCGCSIKLQSKAKFPVTDLLGSGQEAIKKQPNLSNKMNSARPAVYRSKSEIEKMLTPTCEIPRPNQTSCIHVQTSNVSSSVPQMKPKSQDVVGILQSNHTYKMHLNEQDLRKGIKSLTNSTEDSSEKNMTSSNNQSIQMSGYQHDKHKDVVQTKQNIVQRQANFSTTSQHKLTDDPSLGRNKEMEIYTPSHSSLMNSHDANRRIPLFKPKKLFPLMDSIKPPSTQKIIPVFHPQKKPSMGSIPQVKAKSTVNKPFISHTPCGISAQGHKSHSQVEGSVPAFQRTAVTPSSNKEIPYFNTAQKTVQGLQKTPSVSTIPIKKGKAKMEKAGKEQKDKKATKRPKGEKKDIICSTKKVKKLMKAEA